MKTTRILAALLVLTAVFTAAVWAVEFVPSIEYRPGPELVGGDDLLVTPLKDLFDASVDLHDDIEKSLTDAEKELKESNWQDLIRDFETLWKDLTKGAPVENAVVSDIFDVRYTSELTDPSGAAQKVTFQIRIQDLEADDTFMIITKDNGGDTWTVAEYSMDENGVITVTGNTKAAYAVVRDSEVHPKSDTESPKTGVSTYFVPAVIGVVLFGGVAAVCVKKLYRRTAA